MNLTPEVSLEPPIHEHNDGEPPAKHVFVSLAEADGTTFTAGIHLDAQAAPPSLAAAMLACCRGAAATHSPHLAAVLGDVLDSYGRAGAQKSPAALTVAALDKLGAQHQGTPLNVQVPGLPASVPFDVVRAVLVAAGAWE